jgi:2',3'-cyclic-nucleotide 2'-phosphodiesterase (5'-nucleotidase family)
MKNSVWSLIAGLLLSGGLSVGCSTTADSDQRLAKQSGETTLRLSPELRPKDDGYALALFYGADVMGSLKDCGCPRKPEGGLAWRMGYARAFMNEIKSAPTLQVDAGYFFGDATTPEGELFPHVLTQNEWLLKGYNEMNFAVANLSFHDLPFAERVLKKTEFEERKKQLPFLEKIISANVVATSKAHLTPPAFIIHEVAGDRRPNGGKLRIAFVGLTSPGENQSESPAFKIVDPVVAARRLIPTVRRQADVVVVLAYLYHERDQDSAKELAEQVQGIDLIIQANGYQKEREPVVVGKTTIAYARFQTRSLGQALIYLDENGKLAKIKSRFVPLDPTVPKDSLAEKLVVEAEAEITAAQKQWAQKYQKEKPLPPLTPVPWN